MASTEATKQAPKPTGDDTVIDVPENAGNSGLTSFPDPFASPKEFLEYLRSLSIPDLVASWEHLQRCPVCLASTNRYVRTAVTDWSDRIDRLVISHSISHFLYANISIQGPSWSHQTHASK